MIRWVGCALLVAGAFVTISRDGDAEPHKRLVRGEPAPFRACGAGPGGHRIRSVGVRCPAARRLVRRIPPTFKLRGDFRFRDPDFRPVEVSREAIWRSSHSWNCLAQALPRVRVTQFLCVRGGQVLLWRVA